MERRGARQRRSCVGSGVMAIAIVSHVLALLGCPNDPPRSQPSDPDRRPSGALADLATLPEREDLNLMFVVVDTLRADRTSAYRYARETTPALRYFADTGIRFADHWAQSSWTKTSMASLWTSLYPARTEVLNHRDTVSSAAEMPAEILRAAGYATAGIWRNGWVAPNFGFAQGFDVYLAPPAKQAPATLRQAPRAGRIDGTDIDLVYSAIEFLRANGDRRWFLYLHMMDVHQYITTPDNAIFGSSYSDAYDNSIRWQDEQIGMIMSELHALGLASRTLVVVVSDHGEAFGEHGAEGHARDLYGEVVRTPFIIIPPFKLSPGVVVPVATQNVDVWPTLLELLGLPGPEPSDGASFVPVLLERQRAKSDDVSISHLDRSWGKKEAEPHPTVAIREGRYRIVHDSRSPSRDQLFDLESDPGEFADVAGSFHGIVSRLRARVDEYLDQTAPWEGGAPEIELDEMHLRQLRALGYSVEE